MDDRIMPGISRTNVEIARLAQKLVSVPILIGDRQRHDYLGPGWADERSDDEINRAGDSIKRQRRGRVKIVSMPVSNRLHAIVDDPCTQWARSHNVAGADERGGEIALESLAEAAEILGVGCGNLAAGV